MYVILFIFALCLAIPTWGASLVAFWFYNNHRDKVISRHIVNTIFDSFRTKETVRLRAFGSGPINKAFKFLDCHDLEVETYPSAGFVNYSGTVNHYGWPTPLFAQIALTKVKGQMPTMDIIASDPSAAEPRKVMKMMQKVKDDMAAKHNAGIKF